MSEYESIPGSIFYRVMANNQVEATQKINEFFQIRPTVVQINRRNTKKRITLIGVNRNYCREITLDDGTIIRLPPSAPIGSFVRLGDDYLIYVLSEGMRYKFSVRRQYSQPENRSLYGAEN